MEAETKEKESKKSALESENQTSDKVEQIQPREKNAKNVSLIARTSEVRQALYSN